MSDPIQDLPPHRPHFWKLKCSDLAQLEKNLRVFPFFFFFFTQIRLVSLALGKAWGNGCKNVVAWSALENRACLTSLRHASNFKQMQWFQKTPLTHKCLFPPPIKVFHGLKLKWLHRGIHDIVVRRVCSQHLAQIMTKPFYAKFWLHPQ